MTRFISGLWLILYSQVKCMSLTFNYKAMELSAAVYGLCPMTLRCVLGLFPVWFITGPLPDSKKPRTMHGTLIMKDNVSTLITKAFIFFVPCLSLCGTSWYAHSVPNSLPQRVFLGPSMVWHQALCLQLPCLPI